MGGVNRDRELRTTSRFDSTELAELTKKVDADQLDEVDELDPPTVRLASGTTPPRTAASDATPHRPRTTTAHDPLTTSLLAEVTRRTQTTELSPEEIVAALEIESDVAPTASPRLIRRR